MHAALQAHYGGPKQDARPLAYQLADTIGQGDQLAMLDGLQHHGLNALHGLSQLAEHGVNFAANHVLPADSSVRGAINRTVASDDAALAKREADYQARTDGRLGSYVGATAGEILPWMVGVGEARALGLLPKATSTLGKATALAGEGAAMGAATPVTTQGDYGRQKLTQIGVGAVAAPVLHGVTVGGSRAVGATMDRLTDAGRDRLANARLAGLLDMDPQTAETALRNAPQYVPGEQPSIAQVLGSPKVLQAERALRNNPHAAPAFVAQDVANDAARRQVVEGLAGTDADMAAAHAARTAATNPYYAQLPGKSVDPTQVLQALDALHNSGMGVRPNIRNAVAGLRGEITSRAAQDGTIVADILSGLHENAGSHLGPMASAQEKKALGPIKDSIANALDAAIPGYRANLAAYGAASQPINDMRAARSILDPSVSGGWNAGGDPSLRVSRINQALRADDRANFPMSDAARQQLEGVQSSLKRASVSDNKVGTSGSATDANEQARGLLAPAFRKNIGKGVGTIAGGLLSHLSGLPLVGDVGGMAIGGQIGGVLDKIAADSDAAILRKVGGKAANAQKAAEALQAYRLQQLRKQGLLGQLPNYLLPYGAPQIPLLQQTP